MNSIIELQNVHKSFGSNRVLQGLSVSIAPGKTTFIIGRSGEGKSVTLKHIVGILRPDFGSVVIDGENMDSASESQWQMQRLKIGLLFQDGALFDSLSVAENVSFCLMEQKMYSISQINKRIAELLEMVGLPGIDAKYPPELSIGEKKRVGLARALALSPKVLLYDEPTTGMDSLVSELIDELIHKLQKEIPGLTSVVISHDVRSILHVADNIVFLHEGKAHLHGTPDEFKKSEDPIIRQFLLGTAEGPLSRPIA